MIEQIYNWLSNDPATLSVTSNIFSMRTPQNVYTNYILINSRVTDVMRSLDGEEMARTYLLTITCSFEEDEKNDTLFATIQECLKTKTSLNIKEISFLRDSNFYDQDNESYTMMLEFNVSFEL